MSVDHNGRRKLPSLMAVRAFEAAARLGSFTAAAQELLLTQSAISRHVRNLETSVGIPLFHRRGRQLSLTADGRTYMNVAGDAFDRIAAATAALRCPRDQRVFTISMPASLAAKWFTPRLSDFLASCPNVDLCVRASSRILDFDGDTVDAAICYGKGDWPALQVEELVREQVFPVCSPDYLRSCGNAIDFRRVTLLHGEIREGWQMWLKAAGQHEINATRGPQFDDAASLLQAAIEGLGIALGRTLIVANDLTAGRLVAPFATALDAESACWLVVPKTHPAHPRLSDFRRWLFRQVGRGEARTTAPRQHE